jgi:hypothetical protein
VQVSREEKVQNSFDAGRTQAAKHSSVDARQAKCEYCDKMREICRQKKWETLFADYICSNFLLLSK